MMSMKVEDFITAIKEELEIEEQFNLKTPFNSLEIWDSLARLVIISYVDEQFKLQMKTDVFKSVETVEDLINKIGPEKFE